MATGRSRLPRLFGPDGDLRVSEIWDLGAVRGVRRAADAAAGRVGMEFSGPPEIFEVHNISNARR